MNSHGLLISNYIMAYNHFDIDKMVADFDNQVEFENISNGVVTMTLKGLKAFKEQAEHAKNFFSSRKQTITSLIHSSNQTEVEVDFRGVLAMDFPDGLKKGDELKLKGKSVFTFKEGKIVKLVDIS